MELARALLFRGRNEKALDAVKEGLALARARGLEFAQARLLAHATTICVNLGRYEDVKAALSRGDAMPHADQPVTAEELLGKVISIERGGQPVRVPSCTTLRRAAGLILAYSGRLRGAALRRHKQRAVTASAEFASGEPLR